MRRDAVLAPHGPAAAFALTDDEVADVGGGRKSFPVAVTVGDYAFRGRLARMGGENLIGLSRAVREAGGLEIGATYAIEVVLDDQPREVDVPPALAVALAEEGLQEAFDRLSYTARKEMAASIASAKRDDTAVRRLAKALDQLRA